MGCEFFYYEMCNFEFCFNLNFFTSLKAIYTSISINNCLYSIPLFLLSIFLFKFIPYLYSSSISYSFYIILSIFSIFTLISTLIIIPTLISHPPHPSIFIILIPSILIILPALLISIYISSICHRLLIPLLFFLFTSYLSCFHTSSLIHFRSSLFFINFHCSSFYQIYLLINDSFSHVVSYS